MEPPSSIEDLWKEAETRFSAKTQRYLQRSRTVPIGLEDVLAKLNKNYDAGSSLLKRNKVVQGVQNICQCLKILSGIAAKAGSQMFGGAEVCFQALGFLLDVPKRLSDWYDDLNRLFFEIIGFLQEFKIYKRIDDFVTVDQNLVLAIHKVLISFVDICSLSIMFILGTSRRVMLKLLVKKTLFDDDSGIRDELERFRLFASHQSRISDAVTLEVVLRSQHDSKHFARDLLNYLQNDAQIRNEKLDNVIESVRLIESTLETTLMEQKQANQKAQINEMLRWISQSNASLYYEAACEKHVDGTGSWFLKSPEFQQWLSGGTKCLLLHGVPGSGKTVLTSTAISYIEQHLHGNPNQNLSYFFFKIQTRMGINDLLAHLIRSKCSPNDEQLRTKRQITFLQNFHGKYLRGETLREEDLWKCFESIVTSDKMTYIVIDALDECGKTRDKSGIAEAKRKIMKMLRRFWHMENLRFLVSCRDGSFTEDIKKVFSQLQRKSGVKYSHVPMRKDLVNSDINIFIQQRLTEHLGGFLEEYSDWRERIQQKIKPDGMFLLVARQLDLLEQRILYNAEWTDLEMALEELPEDINGVYGFILEEIPKNRRTVARTILKWLLTAQRPLYVLELKELISGIHKGPFNVFETFSNLLVKHEEDNADDQQVFWAHETSTREYLTGNNSGDFHIDLVDAHKTFAKTCIYYLKIRLPVAGHGRCNEGCTECPRCHRFLRYATDNWYKHALFITERGTSEINRSKFRGKTLSFRRSAKILWLWLQVVTYLRSIIDTFKLLMSDKEVPGHHRLANLASQSNALIRWCETTIALVDNSFTSKEDFQRKIKTAAIEGYKEVTRLLLLHGSPIESSTQSYDALMAAATENFTALLAVLLEVKTDTPLKSRWWTGEKDSTVDDDRNEDLIASICQLLIQFKANPLNKNKFAQTAIHLASGGRYGKVVKRLVSEAGHINDQDYSGSTALHFAAASGSLEIVKVLIAQGCDVNARSAIGKPDANHNNKPWNVKDYTAADYELINAAENENWEECKDLIKAGANVRATDEYGSTPLHWACCRGAVDISKLLIEKGANANAARTYDKYGRTPLIEAARNAISSPELVRVLLQAGADPNLDDSLWFEYRTPLHEAAMLGREDLVQLLLRSGGNANAYDAKDQIPADLARKNKHEKVAAILDKANSGIAGRGGKGETPLHMACANNHYQIAEELLASGADIQARADNGWTVLHAAALRGSQKLFQLLLTHGAMLNVISNTKQTVLHEAAEKGNVEILELLLSHTDINHEVEDANGDTPIMTAARASQEGAVRIILEKGSVHAGKKDWRHHTPLHEACFNGHLGIVKLLLARPEVDIEALEKHYSRSPLFHAAQEGHEKVVHLLLEKGASVYNMDSLGWTPLSIARAGGHYAIADALVKKGAPDIEPPEGNLQATPSPPPPYSVGDYFENHGMLEMAVNLGM